MEIVVFCIRRQFSRSITGWPWDKQKQWHATNFMSENSFSLFLSFEQSYWQRWVDRKNIRLKLHSWKSGFLKWFISRLFFFHKIFNYFICRNACKMSPCNCMHNFLYYFSHLLEKNKNRLVHGRSIKRRI